MIKRNYSYFVLLFFASAYTCDEVMAQQTPIYSQYMFNNFLINPACAGAEGYTAVNLTARDQWVGLPNAPVTYALSANMRILKNGNPSGASKQKKYKRSPTGRVGIGGYVFSDKVGLINVTGLQGTYAYHISFQKSQLSFGLGASIYQYKVDKNDITLSGQPSDILIDNSNLTLYIPDFQVGIAYMYKGAYVGASVQDLFQSMLRFSGQNALGGNYPLSTPIIDYRTYNFIGYYLIELTNVYALEPAVWYKMDQSGAKQIDITGRLYYLEDYWAGLSYRTGAIGGAFIFMGGIRYQRYFFGYAFDYTVSSIMKATYGTHEFMIAAKFGSNARRFRWVSRY
jgi:type IX secretion system PorP/SprF family membrane protein